MFTLKEFLQKEVKPALGCTEPGAVALAVARACREMESKEDIEYIKVEVSNSIYKNGMDVGIAGANGARGNATAAALGAICGNPSYELEVLRDCQEKDVTKAQEWIEAKKVSIVCNPEKNGVYIHALVSAKGQSFGCIIEGTHSNITQVTKNNRVVWEKSNGYNPGAQDGKIEDAFSGLKYEQILSLVNDMDQEDIDYIMNGVKMNLEIAEYGLRNSSSSGGGFGKTLKKIVTQKNIVDELGYLIRIYSYAASDARMGGAFMPVMSSAGSGNHGITAVIPVAMLGRQMGKDAQEIAKAIIISHLTTSYVKSKIGRLSPVCGCAVAAGSGAAAGLTYLLSGDYKQMMLAIKTLLANTAGMICDGAKESCALKVGTAAFEAYISALFAIENRGISSPQGIVDASIEGTINNIGKVNCLGMKAMDAVILDIMAKRDIIRKEA